jgi:hypothetical protein
MCLLHLEGAESGDDLLLVIILLLSLVAAIITVWAGSRWIVTPLCRRLSTKTHEAR